MLQAPALPSVMSGTTKSDPQSPHASTAEARVETTSEMDWLTKQTSLLLYGAGISLFSPLATGYQLSKLFKLQKNPALYRRLFGLSMMIFPQQTILKSIQINLSTPVKDYLNPWAAFAVVGILQGGVYGHSNVFFSKHFQLGTVANYRGMFRGVGFAAARDCLSQGIPFVLSESVKQHVFVPLMDPMKVCDPGLNGRRYNDKVESMQHWSSVLSCSVGASLASQWFHNCQISMQADQSQSYIQAMRSVFEKHGIHALHRGIEARVGLLLVVNVFNEKLLKPVWNGHTSKEE